MNASLRKVLIVVVAVSLVTLVFIQWLKFQRPDETFEFVLHSAIYVVACFLVSMLSLETFKKK
jgi:hypothetical protein